VLTEAWTSLRYHEQQCAAYRSKARFVALACGRGSGKTELARRRIVRYLPVVKPWIKPLYAYVLPIQAQASRVAWKPLKDLVPKSWITKVDESNKIIETRFGSELHVVGADKPERLEGVQWDGVVIDESCDQKDELFRLTIRPALSHRDGWCWRIGVPKRAGRGRNDFKRWFDRGASGELDYHESYTWKSSTVLTASEIIEARQDLGELDFDEQYDASWVSASGVIFYAFSVAGNVRESAVYREDRPIIVGSDFNVDPMAWCLGHIVDDRLEVFDELYVRNTNTLSCLEHLFKRYGQHRNGFWFHGDATSRSRKTSASSSDYVQIANDGRFKDSKLFYPKGNPRRADRFAACNARLRNANGEHRVVVHPRCVNLIADLEARSFKTGSNEPDDVGDVGHITDAFGYIIHRRWPLRLSLSAPAGIHTHGA